MKKLVIFALIAVMCAVKQEVRWPEPGFTGASQDPLETYAFDTTLAFEPLSAAEIAVLDSARLAYFDAVKDSFPDMGVHWWASSMRSWLHHTYDSLTVVDKRAGSYYEHLCTSCSHATYDLWLDKPDGGFSSLIDSLIRLRATFGSRFDIPSP